MPRSGDPSLRLSARVFVTSLLGVLLLQAAWALVVPPFRGLDEQDHAFKAAAVAHGDWSAHHDTAAWGEFMRVPLDLVLAAQPVCRSLSYETRDNCRPGSAPDADGLVRVATSAARYDPGFYWLIGTPARPFDGATALYVMRGVAALLCAVLIAAGLTVARSWSRAGALHAALLLTLTPVTLYSTMVAAPNGVELAGAFLVWLSLLGITYSPAGNRLVPAYLGLAALGAVPLATVRTLGPLWLVLVVGVWLVLTPADRRRAALRTRTVRPAAALAVVALLVGAGWSATAGANAVGPSHHVFHGLWSGLPAQVVLWLAQSWAAFPSRTELAPLSLYAVAACAWWVLTAVALRQGTRRERRVLLLVVVLATAVPVAVTARAFADAGYLWQGRYGYPLAMGFVIVCGAVVDRGLADRSRLPSTLALAAASGVAVVTEVIGLTHVLVALRADNPYAGRAEWHVPPVGLVVVLAVAGVAVLAGPSLWDGLRREGSLARAAESPRTTRLPAQRAEAVTH